MMPDCDREGQIFLSTPHTQDRFLFLHHLSILTVDFLKFSYFDCWRPPYCDDIIVAFNDVIMFSDVNLNDGIRDVHYNQCISTT